MKIRQSHSLASQSINFRSFEIGITKTADSRIAHVVDHDDDEVGFSVRRQDKTKAQQERESETQAAAKD